jgi:hypothetical protein
VGAGRAAQVAWALDEQRRWHQGRKPRYAARLGADWPAPDWPAPDRPRAAPLPLALAGRLRPPGRGPQHLASWLRAAAGVSIPVCAAALRAFAHAVGAGPKQHLVLVLDQAGWHTALRLRLPDHVHLLFLPAYSPQLQPAEHLLGSGGR